MHVPLYSKKQRLVGEIDLLAVKGDYCDIYEVKCSYRIFKARKQLERFRKVMSQETEVRNLYFFCGESGVIEPIAPRIRS